MIDQSMHGKIVVVSGASGRLGRLVAERFARDGATIVALVHHEEAARQIPFPDDAEGWAFAVDVTDEAAVAACFGQIAQQFGHLDALVHTVGGWAEGPLLETSYAQWEELLRRNLGSAFLCFREAARLMQGRGGRLIAFAAGQGADRSPARQGAYGASKAGVIRLVESVAAELGGSGVTAHALVPSTILYDGDAAGPEAKGVPAATLVDLCRLLVSPAGAALNGCVLRAYGTA